MTAALTLDQFRVLIAVADTGGFSAAARALGRAQSAITYAVQKLECQIGLSVFDRASYRPALTPAGHALLRRARRVVSEAEAFAAEAAGMTSGLEPVLSLAVDAMFPIETLLDAMKAFRAAFPTLQTRVHAESLGGAARLVLDGDCTLGLLLQISAGDAALTRRALPAVVDLVMVAAPGLALARAAAPTLTDFRDEVQLVLSERVTAADGRDFGVIATQTWRLGDLTTKLAMLRAGLGFGSIPRHMIQADLANGALVELTLPAWDGRAGSPKLPLCAAWRTAAPPGPAGRWLIARLLGASSTDGDETAT